jgi:hypothetical protein
MLKNQIQSSGNNKLHFLILIIFLLGCEKTKINDPIVEGCESQQSLDDSRGDCSESLNFQPMVTINLEGPTRTITTNCIPGHNVGLFGKIQGALNPNPITPQQVLHKISSQPSVASNFTPLLGSNGPDYAFGILMNGVELDPVAAEPFPHTTIMDPNVNWVWNLEATNVNLGLDCNNAHVQPNGKYHYHGSPTLYLDQLAIKTNEMILIGYAADGFPIYYKYAYEESEEPSSSVIEMKSSYQLKEGNRPGDGVTAPCGPYDGVYSADYEYIEGLGHLDEANGRFGVTPNYPNGTYYYVITSTFPIIPRYFKGVPAQDFAIR